MNNQEIVKKRNKTLSLVFFLAANGRKVFYTLMGIILLTVFLMVLFYMYN